MRYPKNLFETVEKTKISNQLLIIPDAHFAQIRFLNYTTLGKENTRRIEKNYHLYFTNFESSSVREIPESKIMKSLEVIFGSSSTFEELEQLFQVFVPSL